MSQRNQTDESEEKSQNPPKSRKEEIIKLNTPVIKGEPKGNIMEQIQRFNEYKLEIDKEKISSLTIDTIQKGVADSGTMTHINEALSSFMEVQKTFEYVKEDFSNMKKFIEEIKGNKALKIEAGGNNGELLAVYAFFFNSPEGGPINELLKKYLVAEYIPFNSREISNAETRKEDQSGKDSDEYKRQSLIEILSYLYITKKNEMDDYFYNIEKLYDLSKYNVNDTQDEERDFSSDITRGPSSSRSRTPELSSSSRGSY
tara:strand:+ start:7139 stop:7912 length:774 start_codon:yes stop_codon:yes gene_type:complete